MPTFGKKGRPSSGRRGRRQVIEEEEAWPPEWKPVEECPQVKLGIISRRIYDLDLQEFDPHEVARIFIQQLRDSRGYELEFIPPRGRLIGTLRLVVPRFWCTDRRLMDKLQFVTKHINTKAKKHDEEYELVELVRFVESLHFRCDLYTFNVRQLAPAGHDVQKTVQAMVRTIGHDKYELMEWRFRPGPPLTPPETTPEPSSSSSSSSSSDDSPKYYDSGRVVLYSG